MQKPQVPGERACTSCIYKQKTDQAHVLAQQESSIKVFLRFLQFMFLVFAILYITLKAGLLENNAFLGRIFYIDYFIYAGGAVISFLYVISYIILYNQRKKLYNIDEQLHNVKERGIYC